jgi:hypothetical protein
MAFLVPFYRYDFTCAFECRKSLESNRRSDVNLRRRLNEHELRDSLFSEAICYFWVAFIETSQAYECNLLSLWAENKQEEEIHETASEMGTF